jgi:RsiW-degrading membrane proteinase PrsW (M82 family)
MTIAPLINGALGLLPVLAFLAMLTQFDTFRLVQRGFVLRLILAGAGAALVAYGAGRALVDRAGLDYDLLVRLVGPILEESLKALVVVYLIRRHRLGFVLDAVIAGFSIGAGFALLENYFYLRVLGEGQTAVWVVRGFGTAIMHGGATAIFAVIAQTLTPQETSGSFLRFLPGLAAAIALHAAFNQFLAHPVPSTIVMMVGLAASLSFILHRDRQSIDRWLEVDFEDYRRLLVEIRSGAFGKHNVTRVLESLRIRFDPAELAEIVHYVELHTELVLYAEEILKARARGEAIEIPDSAKQKLAHFHYIEERIGRSVRLLLRRHLKFSRYEFFQLYKLQRDAGQIASMEHDFNTDLLLDADDREEAKRAYPDIFFALDNAPLRDAFLPFDRRANLSKARSRRWGVISIFLAAGALMLAGAETLYHDLPLLQRRLIAALGAAAGVASLVIALFGMIFRGRKVRWLADRLATERIRQFHFQYYVMHMGDILAGADDAAAAGAFVKRRAEAFDRFARGYLANIDEQLHVIVHEEDCGEGALVAEEAQTPASDEARATQYFSAYARLRFDRQLNYCNHVLRESRSIWKPSAARQAQLLGDIALAGVFGLLVLHGLVFLGAFGDIEWMNGAPIHALAISAAIVALAARTFEEGFQPKREIERMRQYRVLLRRTHARFRAAETPALKIAAMQELERLTYEEMALFLKSNYEAQFVM